MLSLRRAQVQSSQGTKIPQVVQPGQKQKQRPSLPLHLTQIRDTLPCGGVVAGYALGTGPTVPAPHTAALLLSPPPSTEVSTYPDSSSPGPKAGERNQKSKGLCPSGLRE